MTARRKRDAYWRNLLRGRQVVAGLVALDALEHEAEIKLHLSSFGGSVYSGLAVYDAMMLVRAPVSTLCIGLAFSMAAWLLAAGAPGRRYASRNARVMLHQASAGFSGTTGDIKVAAENILQNQDLLTEILALHTTRMSVGSVTGGRPFAGRGIEQQTGRAPTQIERNGWTDSSLIQGRFQRLFVQ